MQIHTSLDGKHSKFKFLRLLRRSVSTVSTQQADSSDCLPCCFHSVCPWPLLSCVGVDVSASCCCRALHRPPSKRKQKGRSQRHEGVGGGHQRPSPSTVSTCCSIPALTADQALHKQPAQILPAGRSHSTSLGVVCGRGGGGRGGGKRKPGSCCQHSFLGVSKLSWLAPTERSLRLVGPGWSSAGFLLGSPRQLCLCPHALHL